MPLIRCVIPVILREETYSFENILGKTIMTFYIITNIRAKVLFRSQINHKCLRGQII